MSNTAAPNQTFVGVLSRSLLRDLIISVVAYDDEFGVDSPVDIAEVLDQLREEGYSWGALGEMIVITDDAQDDEGK